MHINKAFEYNASITIYRHQLFSIILRILGHTCSYLQLGPSQAVTCTMLAVLNTLIVNNFSVVNTTHSSLMPTFDSKHVRIMGI